LGKTITMITRVVSAKIIDPHNRLFAAFGLPLLK
jgi:hypothetical protein